MDLPETTLNTQEAIDASSASADRPAFDPDSIGLINTVSDGTDVPAKTAGKQEDTTDKSLKTDGDAEPEKGTAKEQGSMRFDQHPDWQRICGSGTRPAKRRNASKRSASAWRRNGTSCGAKTATPQEEPFHIKIPAG